MASEELSTVNDEMAFVEKQKTCSDSVKNCIKVEEGRKSRKTWTEVWEKT